VSVVEPPTKSVPRSITGEPLTALPTLSLQSGPQVAAPQPVAGVV
jgi:hypothetical protein